MRDDPDGKQARRQAFRAGELLPEMWREGGGRMSLEKLRDIRAEVAAEDEKRGRCTW